MSYNPNNPNGQATMANSAPVVIASDQSAIPTTASSLPLPAGAATSANQATEITSLATIATNTTGAALDSHLTNVQSAPGTSATTAITVQGSASGAALPISGTVTADAGSGTFAVSAASLPLPTGAATAANQATEISSLSTIATNTTNITVAQGSTTAGQSGQLIQGAVTTAAPTYTTGQTDPLSLNTSGGLRVDGSGVTQPISAVSLPLATGAATSALQSSVQGSATGGTAAVSSELTGGLYNTTLPTLTNGQQAAIQLDASGRALVSQPTASALNVTDATGVNTQGSVAAGTAATKSVLTGAVYNTTTPSPTNGQQVALQVDQYSNLETSSPDVIVTGASAQTATVNNILTAASGSAATNAMNYRSATVQVVSTGTGGTFIFEGSNDNVNFQTIPVFSQLVLTGTPITAAITAAASQLIYTFPVTMQYIRLRIATTITGGSIQAFTRLSQATWTPAIFQVAQATAANLATTATIASGTISTVTNSNTGFPGIIADVASAAITTTTTTAAFTPTYGSSYMIDIPVTVVSGTTPTMQVTVQESADSGTNWYNVYAFPTITTTGSYTSPVITMTGNRVRYVQTIGGTTPSFTRAISRLQSSQAGYNVPTGGILTDASGTTSATPSTSTQAIAANSFRKYLLIQNVSSNTIWVNFTSAATATQPSYELLPGGSLVQESGFVSGEAVNVLSTVASQAFTAKWA